MRPASAPEREHASAASGPRRTATAWLLGIAVTAFLVWDHDGARGYHGPSLHLVLDTVDACVALLAASLAYGRLLRGGSSQDLLLAQGLALLALAGLGLPYAAGVLAGSDGPLVVWLPLTIRLLGSLLILVASLSPLRPVARRTGRRSALAVPVGLVVVVSCLLWAGRARLPEPVRASVMTASPDLAATSGHPLLTAAQSLSGLCFGVASVAFAVQSARRDDPLLRWLGPAFALATLARVHYVVFPSLYTDWLYTGDLLRTGCYVLLLIGATRELRQYWESRPHTAVLGDRRRLARELHDGVIQELAYIRAESHAIPAGMTRDLIVTACDRALDE